MKVVTDPWAALVGESYARPVLSLRERSALKKAAAILDALRAYEEEESDWETDLALAHYICEEAEERYA
jgi:hypothetical protein